MPEYVDFTPEHVDDVMRLCREEGWPSLASDRAKAIRALTAPGVVSVVAVEDGAVLGFAQALTDGEAAAFLSMIAVDAGHRRRGIARGLVEAVFTRTGGEHRLDLLSEPASTGFYERLPHREFHGFRLYPQWLADQVAAAERDAGRQS